MISDFICQNIGIILNLVGIIMVAFSVGLHPDKDNVAYTENRDGKKYSFAYFNYPVLFKLGIILLISGFFFQLNFKI